MSPPLVGAKEVAAHLGLSKATVYEMARDGRLPSIPIAGRSVRFDPADIQELIGSQRRKVRDS